ncbi:aminopeptidase N-like isoform X3 [Bombus affinis]|uniref:aminopeptidase N-like isoform X3 n=1 Tax=Bombus affinis TaxID=309941 RepID=UPI0021B7286B|nr:aminopeptidase N-like isoform X3 [Bombus affinis]
MARILILFLINLIFTNLLLGDVISSQVDEPSYKLPVEAKPNFYELDLTVNLNSNLSETDFKFTGEVKIYIVAEIQDAQSITLNMMNLTVKNITLHDLNKTAIKVNSFTSDEVHELLIITLDDKLKKGNQYLLTVSYSGVVNNEVTGFYRSRSTDKNGNLIYMAATLFKPTGARLAFPCWDEPAFKARFNISITHPKSYHAISNMPSLAVEEPKVENDMKTTKFKTTPRISTYLVAFIVSNYECNEDGMFRVCTKPQAVNQTHYALEKGKELLGALNEYTAINFTHYVPKMDQVLLEDYPPGAMENWGLVTYMESALLYQDGVTTTYTKQSITTIIAHEFTHQWFGNLVSPEWWTWIWLNEGFADYFQYIITHKVLPGWRLDEVFVVDNIQGNAFIVDAGENSRPMNMDANTPEEISSLFDDIAYQKAGSVIRMMSHILTENVFHEGLKEYLKQNAENVVNSTNLFEHLGKNKKWDGASFGEIMDGWVNNAGYPVVNVKRNHDNELQLSQERFSFYETKNDANWWVPITYVKSSSMDFNNTTPIMWLKPGRNETIKFNKTDGWIIVNTQQAGYYRVNYEPEMWKLLSMQLNSDNYENIHVLNRAQLIDDALNMARTNRLNYTVALTLTLYLERETDYVPWHTTFRNIQFLHNMLRTSEQYNNFMSYIRKIMKSVTGQVRYEPYPKGEEPHIVKLLRVDAMEWACCAGVDECKSYTNREFNAWLSNSSRSFDIDLKDNILCDGIRSANKEAWNYTLTEFLKTKDEGEKKSLFSLLACSQSVDLLKEYLHMSIQENAIVTFDNAVLDVISQNVKGVSIALEVLSSEVEKIKKLNKAEDIIKSSVDIIAGAITNEDQFIQLIMFLAKERFEPDIVQTILLKATRNLVWLNVHQETIENWLYTHRDYFNSSSSLTFETLLIIFSIFITRFY